MRLPHRTATHHVCQCPHRLCHPRHWRQDCFDLDDARRSYYKQLFPLNPGAIMPSGPDPGLDVPAGRGSARWEDVVWAKSGGGAGA